MNFIFEDVQNWKKDESSTVLMSCECEEKQDELFTDILYFCEKCHTLVVSFDLDTFVELTIVDHVLKSIIIEIPCAIKTMNIIVSDTIFWDCESEKKLISNIDMFYTFMREFVSSALCSSCSSLLINYLEKLQKFECFRQLFISSNTLEDIVIEI